MGKGYKMKINELVENVEYKCGDGIYRIAIDGFFEVKAPNGEWTESYAPYNTAIGMEFTECEFEPTLGERYYFPVFDIRKGVDWNKWEDTYCDNNTKRCVGAYRTYEQAIQKARELGWIE